MGDLVSIHAGLDEIHQGARAKVQENVVIRVHQIPGCSAGRMQIGPGPENGYTHRSHVEYNSAQYHDDMGLTHQAAQGLFVPPSSRGWPLVR